MYVCKYVYVTSKLSLGGVIRSISQILLNVLVLDSARFDPLRPGVGLRKVKNGLSAKNHAYVCSQK